MNIAVKPSIVKTLIPVLSEEEKRNMRMYYTTFEKYETEISAEALNNLKDHPVWGKLMRDIPKEVSEAANKRSRELQKDAIFKNNWEPYIEYQIAQGITYAKMGLGFRSWYELLALAREYLVPYLNKDHGTGKEFIAALKGMNSFMDLAMGILGEAYVEEKKEIISKLNQELEEKIKLRTAELETLNKDAVVNASKYHALFNSIDEGYCIIEMIFNEHKKPIDYRFLEINAAFEKQTGMHDAVGKRMREFAPDHEEHWFETYGKIALTGESARFENRAEQLHRWYDVYAFRFGEPEKMQVAILFNDITRRKVSEERIIQLNQALLNNNLQLEAVNKELEAFTYSVSHDLRAPLRGINGYSEILSEDYGSKLDEEGNRIIESISANAAKMGVLIDELLAFSRLGRKEPNKAMVDMNELTQTIVKELGRSLPHRARINVGKLSRVYADYNLIHQVMFNLISNAVKYSSKKEKPVVEISSEVKDNEIIFSVKDNGAGFDMQYADKLFGVFQRLHSEEEFEGSGVGLAIVQRLVAKHSGKVWAEAEIDQGASFYFSLNNN